MLPQLGTIPVLPLYTIYCNSGYVTKGEKRLSVPLDFSRMALYDIEQNIMKVHKKAKWLNS